MSEFLVDTNDQLRELIPAIIIEGNDPEDKLYIVLYTAMDDDKTEYKSYEECIGRTATYDFIKGMIDALSIYESKVLVEGRDITTAINVYEFMKHASKFINDPSFDIESYNYGDAEYGEEEDMTNLSNPNNFI